MKRTTKLVGCTIVTILLLCSAVGYLLKENRELKAGNAKRDTYTRVLQEENSGLADTAKILREKIAELEAREKQLKAEIQKIRTRMRANADLRRRNAVCQRNYPPTCRIVRKDDSLWTLAGQYYGDNNLWPFLAASNGMAGPVFNLNIGDCLVIPVPQRTPVVQKESEPLVPSIAVPEGIAVLKEVDSRSLLLDSTVPKPELTLPVPESLVPFPAISLNVERMFIPGQAWSTTGFASPAERGNLISQNYIEQGVTIYRKGNYSIVPFASLGLTTDAYGYDWNNKTIGIAGIKAVRAFDTGLVQVAAGIASEHRLIDGRTITQPSLSGAFWFGWNLPTTDTPKRGLFSSFPGTTWGTFGNTSPAEKRNVIGMFHVQQGVTFLKYRGISAIPFIEDTLTLDTKGYDWNRRNLFGVGAKLSYPFSGGVVEGGVVLKNEQRFNGGTNRSGLGAFANIYFGWNLSKTKARN